MSTVLGGDRGMTPSSRTLGFRSTTAEPARGASLSSGLPLIRFAKAMTDRLLAPRIDFLNHRAPKDKATHQMRRSLASEKVLAMQAVLRVSFADAEEPDMPLGTPAAVYRLIADALDARQQEVRHEGVDAPSFLPLIERENAREYAGDRGERKLLTDEDSIEAIDACLEQKAREREADEQFCDALRQKRARLTMGVAK